MCPINFRWEETYTPMPTTLPRSRSPHNVLHSPSFTYNYTVRYIVHSCTYTYGIRNTYVNKYECAQSRVSVTPAQQMRTSYTIAPPPVLILPRVYRARAYTMQLPKLLHFCGRYIVCIEQASMCACKRMC